VVGAIHTPAHKLWLLILPNGVVRRASRTEKAHSQARCTSPCCYLGCGRVVLEVGPGAHSHVQDDGLLQASQQLGEQLVLHRGDCSFVTVHAVCQHVRKEPRVPSSLRLGRDAAGAGHACTRCVGCSRRPPHPFFKPSVSPARMVSRRFTFFGDEGGGRSDDAITGV
jgi:hypothetical protein